MALARLLPLSAAQRSADRAIAARAVGLAPFAERFEQSLSAFSRLEREMDLLPEGMRAARREELRHLRDRAALHLAQLIAAREAVGLLRHEPVLAFYGVPDVIRARAV